MNEDPTSLDRLHDLVVPPPAPWWPLAPGWWILLGFIAALVLGWLLKSFIRWQKNRYRREALAMLQDTPVAGLSALVKRVALSAWPREEVADLTGPAWLRFLDRTGGMNLFVAGAGKPLENVAFDPAAKSDDKALRRAVKEWIVKHERKEEGEES
ncbi:DUF4381 domain-containing protein [Luteolibacter luteus]|uniref:DUF4381 domain-containing protein n=1 Tax=Luteolibacter luteus TaxID=2728835 RepID=A0A858RPN9_9BACT|nr:DUF4381 domain-containing protein [Luteolibacter luteus]QJE98832.1 DUF4381 domain-containing protein [Luteolibacter luteus]